MMREGRPARAALLSYRSTEFSVEGLIDGVLVGAHVVQGGLVLDTRVRERAEELVDHGDVFALPDEPTRYRASLSGGDLATLLTVLRAFDHVSSFTAAFDCLPVTVGLDDRTANVAADA